VRELIGRPDLPKVRFNGLTPCDRTRQRNGPFDSLLGGSVGGLQAFDASTVIFVRKLLFLRPVIDVD
jgi:hypothetical protein